MRNWSAATASVALSSGAAIVPRYSPRNRMTKTRPRRERRDWARAALRKLRYCSFALCFVAEFASFRINEPLDNSFAHAAFYKRPTNCGNACPVRAFFGERAEVIHCAL